MNSTHSVSCTADSWICEEELPVRAGLKVIRRNDPNYGLTDDEIQDRNEFIRWYLFKEFELFMMIPKETAEQDFLIPDCDVSSTEYSAFNTHDFQKTLRPFDKYGYAMQKIMERAKDLAILHSALSTSEGRLRMARRYELLVELEFRNRLMALVARYNKTDDEYIRVSLKRRIGEVNRRILECKKIWEQYAPWDN